MSLSFEAYSPNVRAFARYRRTVILPATEDDVLLGAMDIFVETGGKPSRQVREHVAQHQLVSGRLHVHSERPMFGIDDQKQQLRGAPLGTAKVSVNVIRIVHPTNRCEAGIEWKEDSSVRRQLSRQPEQLAAPANV